MHYDPDLNRRCYPVDVIARSFQGSHQMIWNMPSDDAILHALRVNGHPDSAIGEFKAEYIRHARALGIKD